MKKVIGATLLLLYLFSFSLSEEEKITWGGKYPPPPKELTWKEKWERSKLSFKTQDALNATEHYDYFRDLEDLYDSLYYEKMREPVIRMHIKRFCVFNVIREMIIMWNIL